MWLLVVLAGCAACPDGGRCGVPGGYYRALVPGGPGPWPTTLFVHGHNSNPEKFLDDAELQALVDDRGWLVLLPAGKKESWNVTLRASGRDEMAFLTAVLDDASARWGTDRRRTFASGFSIGSTMVQNLACRAGGVTAVYGLSGTFFDPIPDDCAAAPIPLRHVHGLADETWPWPGRTFGPNMSQGDVDQGLAMWRAHNGCADAVQAFEEGPLSCERWTCDAAPVELCTHDGRHGRQDGWTDRMADWLLAEAKR